MTKEYFDNCKKSEEMQRYTGFLCKVCFYEEVEENFLVQHVDESTHTSSNILDLVLSKDEPLV